MSVDLSVKRKITPRIIEGSIRTMTANAKRMESGGFPQAAARCRALIERERQRLHRRTG